MSTDASTDWQAWHEPYTDPTSPLSRRLAIVQRHIGAWLEGRGGVPARVLSLCAGDGRDLLGVLRDRGDRDDVEATLVELDAGLVATARASAATLATARVRVLEGDAALVDLWADAVPADLVLLCGVLGNISDADVERTLATLPELCADDATVVWTRSRRDPDLTPAIRNWLSGNGFAEVAFEAPDDVLFSVGVHRYAGTPRPVRQGRRLFTFTT
ncbi:class I SAM-dependent methyltransferase [Oryzihumus sp.]|uniref:class I SAM-dependent methyltransferase n=1 Tax=Oryzihumus sp. TaxID=1968903 RepID=UPI002EDB7674